MRLFRVPLLAAALATVSACPAAEDTDVKAVTAEDFIDASIEFVESCDPYGAVGEQEPILVEALKAQSIVGFRASLEAQLSSPNITFNADTAAACIAALETSSCDAAVEGIDACDGVVVGSLALGDSCALDEECPGDATCFGLTADGCGVCTSTVGTGDDCSAADCEEGSCSNNVCVVGEPDLELGDACTGNTCADGLTCSEGVCVAVVVVQVGAACSDTAYCVNAATTNFCSADNVCTARPTTGGDCSAVPLCNSTVGICGDDGTCVVGGAEGATCDTVLDCQAGLQCDGTCQPYFTLNEPPVCE